MMAGGPSAKRERREEVEELDDVVLEEPLLSAVAPDEGDRESCKTFLFRGEGHTLGNSLRFIIATYPEVVFCAYSMPHPAEDVMHFRIQTTPGILPQDILQRGLHDLIKMSEVVIEKFEDAMTNAPAPMPDEDESSQSFPGKSDERPRSSSFSTKASSSSTTSQSKTTGKGMSKAYQGGAEADDIAKKFKKTTITVVEKSPTESEDSDEDDDSEDPECVDLE